jgi:CheY-like chemotaxis protein
VNARAPTAGKILIADDNRVNRLLLARGLEQEGHTIVFAEHGGEALELLRQQPFDLLLLDVLMPELDGYEVLAKLQDDPHLRDIPVVVTSALDELDSVVRCLEMGAEDYLTKPVNPVLLNARINASLEKKRLRDQQRELISKFATKEVADDLLTSGFSLGGQYVEASAMFCDIRSFTTISESREPSETIELLNDYYLLMMDAITGEGGIVNQMVGDGLMAIFGAPTPREDHRQAAVQRGAGGARQGADPDRRRDRVGSRRRGLHRDAEPRDVHVRRRHGQRRGSPRSAHEGAGPADPDRREHAAGHRRRDSGRGAGRAPDEGKDRADERFRGARRGRSRRDRITPQPSPAARV